MEAPLEGGLDVRGPLEGGLESIGAIEALDPGLEPPTSVPYLLAMYREDMVSFNVVKYEQSLSVSVPPFAFRLR